MGKRNEKRKEEQSEQRNLPLYDSGKGHMPEDERIYDDNLVELFLR